MHKKGYGILLFLILCITHISQSKPFSSQIINMLKKQAKEHIKKGNNAAVEKIITQLKQGGNEQDANELKALLASSSKPIAKPTTVVKPTSPAKKPAPKPIPAIKTTPTSKPSSITQADFNKQQQHINVLEKQLKEKDNVINNIKKQSAQKDTELKTIQQQLVKKDAFIKELSGTIDSNKVQLESYENQIKDVNKEMLEAYEQSKQCTIQLKEKEQKIETLEKNLVQPTPPPLPPRDHPPYVPPKEIRPLPPKPTKVAPSKEGRPDLKAQIKEGITLKPVKDRQLSEIPKEDTESLANVLSKAIKERRKDLKEDVEEDEGEEDDWNER